MYLYVLESSRHVDYKYKVRLNFRVEIEYNHMLHFDFLLYLTILHLSLYHIFDNIKNGP